MSVTGNKVELAAKLNISLPTLSGWMLRYPDFPIQSRGAHGKSYVFDFAVVFEFLRARREEQERTKAEKDDALAQLKLPFDFPGIEAAAPGKSLAAKEEIDVWKLRKLQREEMASAGKLVSTADVLASITAVLSRINRDAHAFIRQIGREQSWPDAYIRTLEARFGDLQRAAVKDLKEQFSANAEPDDAPARAYG